MRSLAALALLAVLCLGQGAFALDAARWTAAKARLVAADGRVIDGENSGITHSEGQGYALVLAEAAGDRAAFDAIWSWTDANLARRDLRLFAWKYDPAATPPVADANNATDGDLMIAWALMRAAARWQVPAFETASAEIRAAVRAALVRRVAGRTVLLPGLAGFEDEGGVTLNLSYLVLPALKAFARAEPQGEWDLLARDGIALVQDARFGRHALNPDWLRLGSDGSLSPVASRPPHFGFDAVRIPLYLAWGGETAPDLLDPYVRLWQGAPPAWVDLRDGRVADFAAPPGFAAVARAASGQPVPPPGEAEGYYSTMLGLLAAVAAEEQAAYRREFVQ